MPSSASSVDRRPASPEVLSPGVLAAWLAAALLVALAASVVVGARWVPWDVAWSALLAPADTSGAIIVREIRVPRTVLAALAGAALGTAGALAQGHTRNPLADPGLLGVSAGAAFAVVVALHLGGITAPAGYIWFAFAGALLAGVAVFVLGGVSSGRATPVTLALAGAALSALLGALTTALVLVDEATLDAFRFWVVGSVAGRDAEVLAQVAPFLVVGLLLAAVHGPSLDTLSLGEDVARALGQDVRRTRWVGALTITVLTGAAVAAAGPIGFVGLVVPHVVRALVGARYRVVVPLCALAGALLLVSADVLGRLVVRPGELQVGVVLALVGGPFFVWMARRVRMWSA